jgi:hypothetical protein
MNIKNGIKRDNVIVWMILLHCKKHPDREFKDGGQDWYQNDQLYRLDSSAKEYARGTKE